MNILPYMFSRPIVFLNWICISNLLRFVNYGIFIPKLYYSEKENRYLDFFDMFHGPLKIVSTFDQISALQIRIIENSEEEIREVVEEMTLRLTGKWISSDADTRRQYDFWRLNNQNESHFSTFFVGSRFLEKLEDLLQRGLEKIE